MCVKFSACSHRTSLWGHKLLQMGRNFRITHLITLTAASSLLLLMLRWSLELHRGPNNRKAHVVETNATTVSPGPTREPLTSWNLTCPERQEGEEPAEVAQPPTLPLEKAIPCHDRTPHHRYEKRGNFWVLYNYIPAAEQVRCWESVTYTAPSDLTYLDNLGPLVLRWRAPISVALYAPGDDLEATLMGVRWARACLEPPLVERHVTFHVVFDAAHVPSTVPAAAEALFMGKPPNCTADKSLWSAYPSNTTYRYRKKLEYPVNLVRNVARDAAVTHFIFPCDIEVSPIPGLVSSFLDMVRRGPEVHKRGRRVFVLAPFSVEKGESLPEDKSKLLQMLREGLAIPFRERVCPYCHTIAAPQEWICSPIHPHGHLGVATAARRVAPQSRWEPFYIGTHDDPLFDERISWEGRKDRRIQAYAMCLMGYEFHVLDNAFVVHRPGIIAVPKKEKWRRKFTKKTDELINSTIVPELIKLYGNREGCEV